MAIREGLFKETQNIVLSILDYNLSILNVTQIIKTLHNILVFLQTKLLGATLNIQGVQKRCCLN